MDALVFLNCCSVDGKRVVKQRLELFENLRSLKDLKEQIEGLIRMADNKEKIIVQNVIVSGNKMSSL